jgi:hypothetical protein
MYYNNETPPYSISENTISILWDGKPHIVSSSSPNFSSLKQAILDGNWQDIPSCLDTATHFETITEGQVKLENNRILYQDKEVHNTAAKKLTSLMGQGLTNAKPWLKFIDKLMANPSHRSREQLYKFLEHRHMPITEEGNVVGYKGGASDYKDIHSGTFDNSIGQQHFMERRDVDDDCNHGCSYGFHIGSHDYADSWGHNGNLMVVEFSPADAVSVPEDGTFDKLRVCRYKVIGESHSRRPVAEGLYSANSTDDRGREILDWLDKRWNKGKSPRFRKLCKRFPGLTVGELEQYLDESLDINSLEWDNNKGDYRITSHTYTNDDGGFPTS